MYHTTDRDGITELNPTDAKLRELLDSLKEDDAGDNPEVWLTHVESGWMLSAYPSGLLTLENTIRRVPEREIANASPEKTFILWKLLAAGRIEELMNEPWQERAS